MKEILGLSRSRDKKGIVVDRPINPWVNCIHAQVGGGRENMAVLVIEIEYEEGLHKCTSDWSENGI